MVSQHSNLEICHLVSGRAWRVLTLTQALYAVTNELSSRALGSMMPTKATRSRTDLSSQVNGRCSICKVVLLSLHMAVADLLHVVSSRAQY